MDVVQSIELVDITCFQFYITALSSLSQFHAVKWSCHALYRDSLPLASFDFATMLHITNTCLPQGFLTIVILHFPPFSI